MLNNHKKTQVLIVGAGPVGMTLALLLHHAGAKVIVIDKRDQPTQLPRGIAVNQASLTIFKQLGLEKIFQDGVKIPSIQIYWKNKKINTLNFENINTEYPYFFHIQQSIVERILEEEVKARKIKYYRSAECLSFQQSPNGVVAKVSYQNTSIEVSCNYLIGCDGGQSVVRDLIESSCLTETYGVHFVVADVDFYKGEQFMETHYYFSPDGYTMLVPIANQQTRLIFSFKGNIDSTLKIQWDQKACQRILSERLENTLTIKNLYWSTQANFGHRISQKVKEGRVILAGDALHQFSPVGGTNMNVGLQDALSLSWRLIQALKNPISAPVFIEQYIQERIYIIKQQQMMTTWFTGLMTRSKHYPEIKNYSLKNASHQLLGYISPSSSSQHYKEAISPFLINSFISKINEAFLAAKFLLITTSKDKFFDTKINQFLCSECVVISVKTEEMALENDYYFIRPDGYIEFQGSKLELTIVLSNFVKEFKI